MHAHEMHEAGKVSFVLKLPYVPPRRSSLRTKLKFPLFASQELVPVSSK
jgi:hypothetical protein